MMDPLQQGKLASSLAGGHDFDYCFTDQELKDILAVMEQQQSSESYEPVANLPFLTSSSPAALQFQPHGPGRLLSSEPLLDGPAGIVKQESSVEFGDFGGLDPKVALPPSTWITKGTANGLAKEEAAIPKLKGHGKKGGHTSRSGSAEYKGHVSHSTVEKQRRDRINSLIDELRELVPAQSPEGVLQDGADSKRPKHVVLSDTIALVRDLQVKARLTPPQSTTVSGDCEEVRSQGAQSHGAQDLIRRTYPDGSGTMQSEQDSPRSSTPPELPSAPEGAPASSGVVVEQGEGCLYVKVNCADRRGLLSDIILALKMMPLEITTAAITTTQGGNVYDVFQVKLDPSTSVTAQDIQCHVHANLYSTLAEGMGAGDKRRRTVPEL